MTDKNAMTKFAKYGPGGDIQFIGEMPAWMIKLQGDHIYVGEADQSTQYIDLASKTLRTYTPAEQQAKDHLPPGWTWKMPQRMAMDLRSAEQQRQDMLQQVRIDRARAYPPLADFADALYWQNRGDASKMDAYLQACDTVKKTYPKPGT